MNTLTHATAVSANDAVRRANMVRLFWIISAIVLATLPAALAMAGASFKPVFLATVLLILCSLPVAYHGQQEHFVVPVVPIFCGAYAIQFALPALFGDRTLALAFDVKLIDEDSQSDALMVAIAALAAFLFVVNSRAISTVLARLPIARLQLNRTRALLFCVLFGGLAIGPAQFFSSLSLETQSQYAAIMRVIQNQLLVAIVLMAWLSYTSRSLMLRILYAGTVVVATIQGLSTGFLEAVLIPAGLVFASHWIFRKRLNKRLLAALVIGVILLNPVKSDFRNAIWYSADSTIGESRVGVALFWVESAFDYWSGALTGQLAAEEAATQLLRRTSMIDVLAHIIDSTPESVPYLEGQTYSYFIYSLIPRFLWPEKPTATANRTLAIEYLLTTPEGAERSTFGVSLLGEGYANFGVFGAIMIMVLMGLVLLALQRMFATTLSGPGGYALFLSIFVYFLNGLGSSAEILFGNLIQSVAVSYVLLWWAADTRVPKP